MASSFSLQRFAALLLPLAALSSCSPDRMVPPAGISNAQPVDDRQLVGRVGAVDPDRELLGRVGQASAYAPSPSVHNGGSAAIDYLDTPNLAGVDGGDPPYSEPMTADNEPEAATAEAGTEFATAQDAPLVIPSEGINIDAELGVGGTAAVAQGPMTIAEGATDQPVVDGIGTDNPVPLILLPQPGADDAEIPGTGQ